MSYYEGDKNMLLHDEIINRMFVLSECAVEVGFWDVTFDYIRDLYSHKKGLYDKLVQKIANHAKQQNNEYVLGQLSLSNLIY